MPAVAQRAPARARSRAFAQATGLAVVVIAVDQLTKRLVTDGVDAGTITGVLPGISLVHIRNHGVAFGFFSSGGAPVLAFTLIALVALTTFLALRPLRRGLWVATGLLVGGAIGNLIDRVANGSVTDFIKLPHWPAFNVADICITFGVLTLLWVLEGPRKAVRDPGADHAHA